MKPLLSIIIATKNRVKYCINSIETILSFSENNFELVVQDNTDTLELKSYIESNVFDKRLVYNYTSPPFSSIDNFNAAMNLATGEYVCLIGDDDGINPEIFDVVRWANKNGIDSICPSIYASYLWPNTLEQYPNGRLTLNYFTSHAFNIKPIDKLLPLLKHGIVNYMNYQLPKVYHGIVKRNCFDQIYNKTGHYFGGLSPDIYSAVALSSIVKKHYIIDYPLTISGACNTSTTVDNLKGAHAGILESAPHFRDRGDYIWDENIPRFYSVQTIWAESALKAIRELDIKVDLKQFNLAKLICVSLLANRNIIKLILAETTRNSHKKRALMPFYLLTFCYLLNILFKKTIKRVKKLPKETYVLDRLDIIDIKSATEIIADTLQKQSTLNINEKLNKKFTTPF